MESGRAYGFNPRLRHRGLMNACESGHGDEDREDQDANYGPPTLHERGDPLAARIVQGGGVLAHGVIARGVKTKR